MPLPQPGEMHVRAFPWTSGGGALSARARTNVALGPYCGSRRPCLQRDSERPCACSARGMSLTAIGFLFVYVMGLVLAFVRHPSFGLLAYIWAFYNLPPSRWWGSDLPDVRWSLVASTVTALALMLHELMAGDEQRVERSYW